MLLRVLLPQHRKYLRLLMLQDKLCLLLPTFAPKLVFVDKVSLDIPLGLNTSRPLKINVSDVMVLIKVCSEGITAQVGYILNSTDICSPI